VAQYVWSEAVAAFRDYFVAGPFVDSYWGVFGWRDTPLVIINATFENALHLAILTCTLFGVGILAFRSLRNARRIVSIFRCGRRRKALELSVADPLFNSLIVFEAIMFALYIASDNEFQVQGRHEYPFIFPAIACAVWYAPTTVKVRRRTTVAIIAALFTAYVMLASVYAISDVRSRYYGPPRQLYLSRVPSTNEIRGDAVGILYPPYYAGYFVSDGSFRFAFDAGYPLRLTGAAADPERKKAARVVLVLDGHRAVPTLSGNYFEGVRDARYANSGFSATLQTSKLREGAHLLSAYAVSAEGIQFRKIEPDREFFITSRNWHFSRGFLQGLAHAQPAHASTVMRSCERARNEGVPLIDPLDRLFVAGRATDPVTHQPVRAAWALVDGSRPYPARLPNHAITSADFESVIYARDLQPGRHHISLYAISSDFKRTLKIGPDRYFAVTANLQGQGMRGSSALEPNCVDHLDQFYAPGAF
jgi:hypothetical protein